MNTTLVLIIGIATVVVLSLVGASLYRYKSRKTKRKLKIEEEDRGFDTSIMNDYTTPEVPSESAKRNRIKKRDNLILDRSKDFYD